MITDTNTDVTSDTNTDGKRADGSDPQLGVKHVQPITKPRPKAPQPAATQSLCRPHTPVTHSAVGHSLVTHSFGRNEARTMDSSPVQPRDRLSKRAVITLPCPRQTQPCIMSNLQAGGSRTATVQKLLPSLICVSVSRFGQAVGR